MALELPNLDDRTFEQLRSEAVRIIKQSCPEWTDLSPGDPGMVLLEVFAYLTEAMIYRLNRVPEKAYVEFLRLLGVKILPPSAASVRLVFRVEAPRQSRIEIPAGTRVTVERSGSGESPPVFSTAATVHLEEGQTEVLAKAYHADWIDAELGGMGTGLAGQTVTARRVPIIAPTGDSRDLMVGVEAGPNDPDGPTFSREGGGKTFQLWQEVESFTNLGSNRRVYLADRTTGVITFAPALQMSESKDRLRADVETLAEVPAADREIRLWYRAGGGRAGNVAAHTLTVLKDPIAGVAVTNPEPAGGGRDAESVENALHRGPTELRRLDRVVTAEDYEEVAVIRNRGAVCRAKAFTGRSLWAHAPAGTVEVLIVPDVPREVQESRPVSREVLEEHQRTGTPEQVLQMLEERHPLGTACRVSWVRYKPVRVRAKVTVHREEDPDAVERRVVERLQRTISPLPSPPHSTGWRFGRPLHVSQIYDICLTEPGVSRVEGVAMHVDDAPQEAIEALAADGFQPRLWYAACAGTLYRSVDDGDGWDLTWRFAERAIKLIRPSRARPGLLVVITRPTDEADATSALHVSWDCGESWDEAIPLETVAHDVDWMPSDERNPIVVLATDRGLLKVRLRERVEPVAVPVDSEQPDLGFYAVAVARDANLRVHVAAAAQRDEGVYLAYLTQDELPFQHVGLRGKPIRALEVRDDGDQPTLWAAVHAPGDDPGEACFVRALTRPGDGREEWQALGETWQAGSCYALAFHGRRVYAGSFRRGALSLDVGRLPEAPWEPTPEDMNLECGLPLLERRGEREQRLFEPVTFVATHPLQSGAEIPVILVAGSRGIHRSNDGGRTFKPCSGSVFDDKVTLSPTRLFCSGEHDIEVVSEDEANRD